MSRNYFTKGLGTKFQRSADNGINYSDVMGVIDITPPGKTRAMMDVSDISDATDEFAAGNITPGKCELTVRYKDGEATVKACHDDMDADEPGYYRIVYANGKVSPFRALIESWDPQSINRAGDVQAKLVFQVSGAVPYPSDAT